MIGIYIQSFLNKETTIKPNVYVFFFLFENTVKTKKSNVRFNLFYSPMLQRFSSTTRKHAAVKATGLTKERICGVTSTSKFGRLVPAINGKPLKQNDSMFHKLLLYHGILLLQKGTQFCLSKSFFMPILTNLQLGLKDKLRRR